MTIYAVITEDHEIVGAAEDLETAKNLAQEHASGFDCKTTDWEEKSYDMAPFQMWHTNCYPNDQDTGIIFRLNIEPVELYRTGTIFPAQIVDPDFPDLPNWLRRQAD